MLLLFFAVHEGRELCCWECSSFTWPSQNHPPLQRVCPLVSISPENATDPDSHRSGHCCVGSLWWLSQKPNRVRQNNRASLSTRQPNYCSNHGWWVTEARKVFTVASLELLVHIYVLFHLIPHSLIITGDTKGDIYFYDETLSLLLLYNKLNLDPIASISFTKECKKEHKQDCILEDEPVVKG